MRLVYIVFTANNYAPFYLWQNKNLVKYQDASKYYDHDCREEKKVSQKIEFLNSLKIEC